MASSKGVQLGAEWQLNAALLSRPVDLTALVTMSLETPEQFFVDDTLHRMVKILLNEQSERRSSYSTKRDTLHILANLSVYQEHRDEIKVVLQGVSEWFDEYLASEPLGTVSSEPELLKTMVLLLSRAYEYSLKTEDVLELAAGERKRALMAVVCLLEDGETLSATLVRRRAPGAGGVAQWEKRMVAQQYEKPLLLQLARLLRGFTHPTAYFSAAPAMDAASAASSLTPSASPSADLEPYSVEAFSQEIDGLLAMSLSTNLVYKLSLALHDCLFLDDDESDEEAEERRRNVGHYLDEADHRAVSCFHIFLHNLYSYSTSQATELRSHLLRDPALVPHLVLPYIQACADAVADHEFGAAESAAVLSGMSASLKTLIIASFRAPSNKSTMRFLRDFNPTHSILRASTFVTSQPRLFALICLLNINMNALDLAPASYVASGDMVGSVDPESKAADLLEEEDGDSEESLTDCDEGERVRRAYEAHALLHELALCHMRMTQQDQLAVLRLVLSAGGLPLCRDAPSYLAVVSVLHGGLGGQNAYMRAVLGELGSEDEEDDEEDMEDYEVAGLREQVKSDAQSRYETLSPSGKSAREEEEQASVMSDARREAVRGSPRSEEDAEVVGRRTGGDPHPAEAKDGGTMARSSPAATVAARDVKGEAKARAESKSQRRSYSRPDKDDGDRFRLLGDLPSLQEQGRGPGDLLSVGLDLSTAQVSLAERLNVAAEELARALPPGLAAKSGASRSSPSAASQGKPSSSRTKGKARGRRSQPSTEARAKADAILKQENSEVPGSFACAVNGHVMKEPMVSPYGHSFERSTIELWLRTQGSVCPVTHQPLTADMLKPDTKLRDQIVRWQIQRSTSSQVQALTDEEDLYEF